MSVKIVAIITCLAGALAAQEPQRKITASFYAFDYVPGLETVRIMVGEESFEEIRLSKANIVGPIEVSPVEGVLSIFDKPAEVDGKVTHPVISTAKVPQQIQRALVVLFPAPKGSKDAYGSLVLNHDLRDFPLGVYRMINASPFPVRGAIARNLIEVKPGGIANLKAEGEPGAIVPVRFEFFDGVRWNLLTETRAAIRNDRRWITCIYRDPVTGRMNMRSIPDRSELKPQVPE
jgi:hypothetical protein